MQASTTRCKYLYAYASLVSTYRCFSFQSLHLVVDASSSLSRDAREEQTSRVCNPPKYPKGLKHPLECFGLFFPALLAPNMDDMNTA
jgi:hypothetical protein